METRRCYVCDAPGAISEPEGVPYCAPCSPPPRDEPAVTAPKPRMVQLAATQQEVISWIVESATRVWRCGGRPYGAILGPVAWAKLQEGIGDIQIWTPAGSVKLTTDVDLPNYAIHVVDKETWDMITTGSNANVRLSSALSVAISNASAPLGLKGSHEIAAELRGTPPGASPCARVIDAFFGVDRTVPLENPDALSIQEAAERAALKASVSSLEQRILYWRDRIVADVVARTAPPFRGTIRFPNPARQPRPLHERHQVEPVRVKLDISKELYVQRKQEDLARRMAEEEARLHADHDRLTSDDIAVRVRYWGLSQFIAPPSWNGFFNPV